MRADAHRSGSNPALLTLLLLVYLVAYLDRQIISLLVEPLKAALAISDVQVSYLQGLAFVLFYTVCGLPIGYLVDRYSRKLIVALGLAVWSGASAAGAFVDSYDELLVARFLVGAGEAALLPAAYSMLGDAFAPARLSRAISVFSLGAIAGGALALTIGGQIAGYATERGGVTLPYLGHFAPWQFVFLAVGSLGLPVLAFFSLVREPARMHHKAPAANAAPAQQAHFGRHWRFYVCHIAGFSLLCTLMAASSAWQPAYLQRSFGFDIRSAGGILGSLHLIGGVAGMLGGGVLADWLQRRGYADGHLRIYIFALPLILIAALAAYGSGRLWMALPGIGVISVMAPFIAIAASSLALATPPGRRGIVSAVFLFSYNLLGFGAGPTIAAWLAGRMPTPGDLGSALALMFLAITPIVLLLFFLGLKPMRLAVAEVGTNHAHFLSTKAEGAASPR